MADFESFMEKVLAPVRGAGRDPDRRRRAVARSHATLAEIALVLGHGRRETTLRAYLRRPGGPDGRYGRGPGRGGDGD